MIAIFVSLFISFNVFAFNMILQYRKTGRWADYLHGERVYMFLSLFAKTILAWQVFAGTLAPWRAVGGPVDPDARRRGPRDLGDRQLHAHRPGGPRAGSSAGSRPPAGALAGPDGPRDRPDVGARPGGDRCAGCARRAGRPRGAQRGAARAACATSSSRAHGEDRFPVRDRRHGLARVRPGRRRPRSWRRRRGWTSWWTTPGRSTPSGSEGPDGIEATLAVLVVGPFALTAGLLPLLRRTPGSRVIAVTSGGMYTQAPRPRRPRVRRDEPFSGPRAYARAKRAQVALMREWARRLRADGISFSAMHPGWADTPGLAEHAARLPPA